MSLDLVATPGAADANAFATVAEASAVAAYRGAPGAAFIALEADQKIQALVTEAADIDSIGDDFIGERATDEQALNWPRTGTDYDDDELPRNLVNANIEAAIAKASLYATGATADPLNREAANGNIKRKKLDVIETEYFERTQSTADSLDRFPRIVQNLLRPLVSFVDERAWGSAAVSRSS